MGLLLPYSFYCCQIILDICNCFLKNNLEFFYRFWDAYDYGFLLGFEHGYQKSMKEQQLSDPLNNRS